MGYPSVSLGILPSKPPEVSGTTKKVVARQRTSHDAPQQGVGKSHSGAEECLLNVWICNTRCKERKDHVSGGRDAWFNSGREEHRL